MLYQHGYAAAGELNSRISKVDLSLDETPSMCHSGLPPPPHGVYKEPGEDLQLRLNASQGATLQGGEDPLMWKTTRWKGPTTQEHCHINGSSRSLVLAITRLHQLLQLCFTCLTHQALLFLRVVFLGFHAAHGVVICSKLFTRPQLYTLALCKSQQSYKISVLTKLFIKK